MVISDPSDRPGISIKPDPTLDAAFAHTTQGAISISVISFQYIASVIHTSRSQKPNLPVSSQHSL
jgi:hypothetical protein